jgi:hypothetical protein
LPEAGVESGPDYKGKWGLGMAMKVGMGVGVGAEVEWLHILMMAVVIWFYVLVRITGTVH